MSRIEWTDDTWDPVEGCRRKSPGCDHCWAVQLIGTRFAHIPSYANLVADGQFTGVVSLRHDRLRQPYGARTAKRWFVCSRSDLFGAQVPDAYIAAVWCQAYWTSQEVRGPGRARPGRLPRPVQTFQVLTKRERRMSLWTRGWTSAAQRKDWLAAAYLRGWCTQEDLDYAGLMPDVMPNIWLGVSIESQEYADARVAALLRSPAAVRWVSAEPLLGPVDLTRIAAPSGQQPGMVYDALGRRYGVPGRWEADASAGLDWVVVGGETARRRRQARPMHPDWARTLRDQCTSTGVGFFFKQWGDWAPSDQFDTAGWDDVAWDDGGITMWPDGRIRGGCGHGSYPERAENLWPVGKRTAGHRLDEREWLEGPRGVTA